MVEYSYYRFIFKGYAKNGHMHVEVKNHPKILLYRLMFQILLLTFFKEVFNYMKRNKSAD